MIEMSDIFRAIFIIIIISFLGFMVHWCSKPARLVDKLTEPDHIITSYEWYENTYQQIQGACATLSDLQDTSVEVTDRNGQVLAIKSRINRMVTDYNGKSRMITRNTWQASHLPHTINVNNPCENQ